MLVPVNLRALMGRVAFIGALKVCTFIVVLPFLIKSSLRMQEVTKFINAANETKAASKATKEGAQLRLVKAPVDSTPGSSIKKPKAKAVSKK